VKVPGQDFNVQLTSSNVQIHFKLQQSNLDICHEG